MSCRGCKKHFSRYIVPLCGCHWCTSCYQYRYDLYWERRMKATPANKATELDGAWIKVVMRTLPWRCSYCKRQIPPSNNNVAQMIITPGYVAEQTRLYGSRTEKKKRAAKDKANQKRAERRLRAKLAKQASIVGASTSDVSASSANADSAEN